MSGETIGLNFETYCPTKINLKVYLPIVKTEEKIVGLIEKLISKLKVACLHLYIFDFTLVQL